MLRGFDATASALAAFDGRHLNASCEFVVPEIDERGPLSQRSPEFAKIVRQLNRDCAPLHVTRYAAAWNIGYWFLKEASEGRTYGGRVLEVSGESSVRRYLLRPQTQFVEAAYPGVDVQSLDRAHPPASFDLVVARTAHGALPPTVHLPPPYAMLVLFFVLCRWLHGQDHC